MQGSDEEELEEARPAKPAHDLEAPTKVECAHAL